MPAISETMRRYRQLEDDLRLVRSENPPGSSIEDPIIDEMARLWWELSDLEREILDREGPTCWPEPAEPEGDTKDASEARLKKLLNPTYEDAADSLIEDGTYAHPADAQSQGEPEPTEAERAAAREKLIAEANEATDRYNRAVLDLEKVQISLRNIGWLIFGLAVDTEVLPAVAVAIAALPVDATMQQIELARTRATIEVKKKLMDDAIVKHTPMTVAAVLTAVETMHEAKRTADAARRKVESEIPDWFLPAMLGMAGGAWLSKILNPKGK